MLDQMERPAKNIPVRDTLFGDLPFSYWAGTNNNEIPWSLFKKAKDFDVEGEDWNAIAVLQDITALPGLESRQYLQAFYFLRQLYAVTNTQSRLLGAVIEVGMEHGTDLLAVYADHSARYYHNGGGAIIWETRTDKVDAKIDHILALGKDIVQYIGPWKEDRLPAPKPGIARINFLTTTGLHFGEAPQAVLFKDHTAGKIMYAMLDMMETLINSAGTEK